MENIITAEQIDAYCLSLVADERVSGPVQKYRRDITVFARWIEGRSVSKKGACRRTPCSTGEDHPHVCGERRMFSPTVISLRDREIIFGKSNDCSIYNRPYFREYVKHKL